MKNSRFLSTVIPLAAAAAALSLSVGSASAQGLHSDSVRITSLAAGSWALSPEGDVAVAARDGAVADVFRLQNGSWQLEDSLSAPTGVVFAVGGGIDVAGGVLVIGAPSVSPAEVGRAFVYRYQQGSWQLETTLLGDNGPQNYGFSVATDGETIVVGATHVYDAGTGEAYVYRYDGATWPRETILFPNDPAALSYGYSVAVDGDTLVVNDDFSTPGGTTHIYRRQPGGGFLKEAQLSPGDVASGDLFGWATELSGDTLLVSGRRSAIYEFRRQPGGGWAEQTTFQTAASGAPFLTDGKNFALNAETLLIASATAVHVFERPGQDWLETDTLPMQPDDGDEFGSSVAISGDGQLCLIGMSDSARILSAGAGAPGPTTVPGLGLPGALALVLGTWAVARRRARAPTPR